MDEYLYSQEHFWFLQEPGGAVRFGVTGNLMLPGVLEFVQLPKKGETFEANSPLGCLETDKCTVDIRLPFAVKILQVNEVWSTDPKKLLDGDMSAKWLCQVELLRGGSLAGLLTARQYEDFCTP